MSKKNPIVFMDVAIGGGRPRRMVFELFADVVPLTAENFRQLCLGDSKYSGTGRPYLEYTGSVFHYIRKGKWIMGGDIVERDGSAGYSIYGKNFEAENYNVKHDARGILSMLGHRPDSKFLITLGPIPDLDENRVAFGKLIKGEETLTLIENVQVRISHKPVPNVKIVRCGELLDYEANKEGDKSRRESDYDSGDDQYKGSKRHKSTK